MTTTMTDLETPETRDVRRLAEELEIRTQAWIDGRYVDAASGETFPRLNPATGTEIAQVAAGDVEDVDRAVAGAKAAFESGVWRDAAPRQRKKVLTRLAELIEEHADELALLETLDMGKPIRDARRVDIPKAAECIAYFGEACDKVYDEVAPTDPAAVVMVLREPLGVIGAVVPWNFPLMMASWKLGPALATGNSVVLKPAEQSPLTALRLAELGVGGRSPRRRAAGGARVRRDRRTGARPPYGRRHDRVHRLHRGRQVLPPLLGRVEHEARRARVRRQVAAHRDARLRRPRRRSDGGGVGRLLQPGRGLQRRLPAARARRGQGRVAREGRQGRRAHPPGRPARPEDADGRDRRRDAARSRARLHRGRQGPRAPVCTWVATGCSRTRAASSSSRRSSTPCRTT